MDTTSKKYIQVDIIFPVWLKPYWWTDILKASHTDLGGLITSMATDKEKEVERMVQELKPATKDIKKKSLEKYANKRHKAGPCHWQGLGTKKSWVDGHDSGQKMEDITTVDSRNDNVFQGALLQIKNADLEMVGLPIPFFDLLLALAECQS